MPFPYIFTFAFDPGFIPRMGGGMRFHRKPKVTKITPRAFESYSTLDRKYRTPQRGW